MVKKKPKFGALPTLNMPKKSIETTKAVATRTTRSIVRNDLPTNQNTKRYKNFPELCKRVETLKPTKEWTVQELHDRIVLKKGSTMIFSELEIMIDDSLGFTVSVYGWRLPEDHEIYNENFRSVTNITVSDLIKKVETMVICPGVEPTVISRDIKHHVIPKPVDPLLEDDDESGTSFSLSKEFWRTHSCLVLCGRDEQCPSCYSYQHKQTLSDNTKSKKLAEPAHLFAPISKTAPERIKATLQAQRLKCAELEKQLNEMKLEIQKSSVEIDHELSKDITTIIGNSSENITPFMNLFWQEQKKLLTNNSTGVRYHPAVEATKFLLNEGMEYVLTERFCQDPVEEYFGNQRKLGRRSDNPDIKTFGYNSNTIRVQRAVSCQSGNTRGRKDRSKAWVNVSNDPVPKKKKT